ncbi:thermonuclease family protein [Heyndrickxia coagulans]|uniref:thermonuclease family protein n=1 Tax=Heyndrickxia coagulans TaxID=1398 RepID=UPI003F59E60D
MMKKGSLWCLGVLVVLFILSVIGKYLYGFFLLLSLACFFLLIAGLFEPKLAFWSKKKTRKSAGIGYLILTIVFSVLFAIFSPNQDVATKDNKAKTASSEIKKEESKKSNISAKKADDGKKEEKNKQADENKRADEQKKDKASVAAGTTAAVSTKNKQSKSNNTNKQKTSATPTNQEPVTLVETVDGDTIKVNYKGKTETVRYLLVDTPEEKKPGTCVQPYAVSAYNKNKQLVNSGKLTLEFETNGDKYDKYGRLLAYVFVNGKSVQEELLKGGYARVAYIYNPPYKYLSKYESDENTAKSNHLNIWSESGYVTDSGFNGCAKTSSGTSTASSDSSTTSHSTNSGSSNGSSSSATSAPTSSGGTEIFANCTELRKKYPNGVPKGHPAYQEKMDRDHDNYACER